MNKNALAVLAAIVAIFAFALPARAIMPAGTPYDPLFVSCSVGATPANPIVFTSTVAITGQDSNGNSLDAAYAVKASQFKGAGTGLTGTAASLTCGHIAAANVNAGSLPANVIASSIAASSILSASIVSLVPSKISAGALAASVTSPNYLPLAGGSMTGDLYFGTAISTLSSNGSFQMPNNTGFGVGTVAKVLKTAVLMDTSDVLNLGQTGINAKIPVDQLLVGSGVNISTFTSGGALEVPSYIKPGSYLKATLLSATPAKAGVIYYCSNCTVDAVVVSTAATPGGVANIANRAAVIQ